MKKTLVALLLFLFFIGCENDDNPNYPVQPFIVFQNVTFTGGPSVPDTLKITINYQDGDADLGLNQEIMDLDSPYHDHYVFVTDGKGGLVKIPVRTESDRLGIYRKINYAPHAENKIVTIKTREKENYAFLPDDPCRYASDALLLFGDQKSLVEDPSTITTLSSGDNEISTVTDNFYFETNPSHFNIEVDFLIGQPDGSFAEFDFRTVLCGQNFDGRFPRMPFEKLGPFHAKQRSRWNGELQYSMISAGFRYLFNGKKMKLRVLIRDRALNESNVIETPVFTVE